MKKYFKMQLLTIFFIKLNKNKNKKEYLLRTAISLSIKIGNHLREQILCTKLYFCLMIRFF
jgi:hypothetical protein